MALQPQTRSGRLSEVARHVIQPDEIASTGWPAVRDTCAGFGVRFDEWQDGTGRLILAKRSDGTYAASVGGVAISIPRQVGKTFLLGAVVFALCLLNPGLTVIWTAHRLRTANETFQSMRGFARRKLVKPHIEKIVLANGDEAIEFCNGSRVLFGARERGFGRGFANVGVLVFDEAQILTDNAIDDMLPATNTAVNPLVLYTGTPPRPTDPSEVFTRLRVEALSGDATDSVYIEFSADPDADPDDRLQWSKANPSYPRRTPETAMLRLRKNLSADSFVREALGIWDDSGAGDIDMAHWGTLEDIEDQRPDPVAFAVTVNEDRSWSTIGLAGRRGDGRTHIQVVQSGRGTGWVIDRLVELDTSWHPVGVAVNPNAPAGALISGLNEAGIEPVLVTGREVGQACGALYDAIAEGTVRHSSQPLLNISVQSAVRHSRGGSWVWKSRSPSTDIAPLDAVTLAAFLLAKPRKTRTGVVRWA